MAADPSLELLQELGRNAAGVFGDPLLTALIFFIVFALFAAALRLPVEMVLIIGLLAMSIFVSGLGIPTWIAVILALIAGVIIYLVILRVLKR